MSPSSQSPLHSTGMDGANSPAAKCAACGHHHPIGRCPLKLAGVEYCPLCGIAHFGRGRTCPHINSVTQLQAMQEAIKHSPESPELKELAKKKLTGLIGSIRHKRKLEEEAKAVKEIQVLRPSSQPGSNSTPSQHPSTDRQVSSRQTNGVRVGKENWMTGLHPPPPLYRQ